MVVVALQHGGQGDDAHGDDGGGDDADHGGEDRRGDDRGRGETAAHSAEPLVDDVEHLVDQAGPLQHRGHEDEQRNGRELVVGHRREDAPRDDIQHVLIADQVHEHHRQAAGDEGQRHAGHQEDQQRPEHDDGEPADRDVAEAALETEQEALFLEGVVEEDVDDLDENDEGDDREQGDDQPAQRAAGREGPAHVGGNGLGRTVSHGSTPLPDGRRSERP